MSGLVYSVSPLERGPRGVLRWAARHRQKRCRKLCLVLRGVIRQSIVRVFDFRKQSLSVTHPRPSREGRLGYYFSVWKWVFNVSNSPLERGWRGVLRGEAQQGQRYFATVGQGGICRLWVVVFELNSYARASHTPGPSLGREDWDDTFFW